ncbi:hypothetical protein LSTR_LSTR015185 [Laodelphax striatellus]|uniref:Uncharacterized protein n=1 Tax=Laodelphax striatellus TaxID=195883 RepID=A0A482WLR4_LAOST|nr:hypothetical protein LSTR_LSTR015185 [Laodelphax striatellus]
MEDVENDVASITSITGECEVIHCSPGVWLLQLDRSTSGAKYVAKKSGYNKLACCEDTAPDNSNGNVTSPDDNSPSLVMRTDAADNDNHHLRHHTDSSSASDFDLEEEEDDEDFSEESDYGQ